MAFTVKYTKSQYLAKITELEGCEKELSEALGRLESLRDQIDSFWHDENARKEYNILLKQINNVKVQMDRVRSILSIYRSTVEKLDGINIDISELLGEALGAISSLGL